MSGCGIGSDKYVFIIEFTIVAFIFSGLWRLRLGQGILVGIDQQPRPCIDPRWDPLKTPVLSEHEPVGEV